MKNIGNWLLQAWQWLGWHISHMSLPMALWIGFALLTILLLVLMRTRWAPSHPSGNV